jgi:hypothetical protein
MTPDDLPSVARIYETAFGKAGRDGAARTAAALADLLFAPTRDPDLPSLVSLKPDGRVGGYLGVLPLAMRHEGRPIRAAVPTSLAVEDPAADPLAGAKLVRAFLAGPQDVSLSEPINAVAMALWTRLGAEAVASESMEWLKVLRPAGFAAALAAERSRVAGLARPLARAVDRLIARAPAATSVPRGFTTGPVDAAAFVAAHAEVAQSYALHPTWTPADLDRLIGACGATRARGTLRLIATADRSGRPAGLVAYLGGAGRIARVVQMLARPDAAAPVIEGLFADLAATGAVAAKGRTQARLLDPLLSGGALLFRRHSSAVHARDPRLVEAVRRGEALTGGFAGESWMPHILATAA